MANNDLAIQFTDENYSTRSEVSQKLQIGYVDSIWNTILAYRSSYNRYLQLRLVDNSQFAICLCPSIQTKLENIDAMAIRLMNKVGALHAKGEYEAFRRLALSRCLNEFVKLENLQVSEDTLLGIISGQTRLVTPSLEKLHNYLSALTYIERTDIDEINVDLLAELYSCLTGNNELTHFYREDDDLNKVIIGRTYNSAPHTAIEPMMENLFSFLKDPSVSKFVKVLVIGFYLRYVKPFPRENSEISILLMKSLLAKEYGPEAILIPLEKFLSTNSDYIKKMFTEVQSTKDITYYISATLPILNTVFESFNEEINHFEADEIQRDYYGVKEEEAKAEVLGTPVVEPTPVVENVIVEETVIVEQTPEPVKEPEPAPVVESSPIPAPQETVSESYSSIAYSPSKQVIASYLPPALDEREAQRLEEHLLELDPTMHRGEAAFYARHCTLGKKYTIQQCKRYLECAYETARKTMERLTELGYYKREMVKNKSVYTPIERKDQ